MENYDLILDSLLTWRQIPQWTLGEKQLYENEATRWVVTGRSS
jgi:hypothetical protein